MRRLLLWCFIAWSLVATPYIPLVLSQPNADSTGTLSVNGSTRSFVYAMSAAAAPAAGRPLVIHLHGDGGTMGISAAWRQAVLANASGAVFLSAQGRNNIPDAAAIDGSAWQFRMDESGQPYDDVDFIEQLITQATTNTTLLEPIRKLGIDMLY